MEVGQRYRFGRYELRPSSGELLRDGRKVDVPGKQFELLVALAEASVESKPVASVDWIVRKLWYAKDWDRGRRSLKVHISHLKERLEHGAIEFITVDGERGYRLVDPVQACSAQTDLLSRVRPYANYAERATWLAVAPASAEGDLTDWHFAAGPLREAIAKHGGQQVQEVSHVLTACFPGPEAALACSRRMHQIGATVPRPDLASGWLKVLLLPDEPVSLNQTTRRQALIQGVAEVPAGETWLSADLGLIDKLDGDVAPLPGQHALETSLNEDLVRLLQPAMEPSVEPMPHAVDRLDPMVAVIPFTPLIPEDGRDLPLGNILTHVLTAALHRSKLIKVIAFQSAAQFRHRAASIRQIALALDADYIVTGEYRRQGRKIAVSMQLADGRSQSIINTRQLTASLSEVNQENSNLVMDLADNIVAEIVSAELPKPRQTPLPDLPSHTLLLGGIHLMYRLSPAEHRLSHEALQTLHQRVPRHAVPLAWLALWHVLQLAQGWSENRQRDTELAESCARRALDIDSSSSLALTMLGSACNLRPDRRDEALVHFDQALENNPNEAMAWLQKGNALSFAGRGLEAVACIETALRLSPLDPAKHYYLALLASAALSAGRWDQAADGARRSLLLNHRHVPSHRALAIASMLAGRSEEGRAAVARLRQLQPALTAASYVADSPGKPELARLFAKAMRDGGLPQGPINLD